jgi:hypothetical protein
VLTPDEARERAKLNGPQETLADIISGRMLVSLNHKTGNAYLEEYDGKKYRDPDDPDRKLLVCGAMTLHWAGYLTDFGTVTDTGRAALLVEAN